MGLEVKVSIRCAVYNHEKYLRKCLDGFVIQKTNFKFEAVVHDDASTDGSANIIKEYAEKYPEIIKPIYQTKNLYSQGISRNRYVDPLCTGDFWAVCEGDDYWTDENKLQKQYDFMIKHPKCSICAHAVDKIDFRNNRTIYFGPSKTSRFYSAEDVILGGGGFVSTNSLFCKREVFENKPSCFNCKGIGDYQLQMYGAFVGEFYYMSDNMGVYNCYSSANSWSARNSSREKSIDVYTGLNNMLSNVNRFFVYKYDCAIKHVISQNMFSIQVLNNNYKELISNEVYKSIFKSQNFRKKIKIYLGAYFPRVLNMIQNIRGKNAK